MLTRRASEPLNHEIPSCLPENDQQREDKKASNDGFKDEEEPILSLGEHCRTWWLIGRRHTCHNEENSDGSSYVSGREGLGGEHGLSCLRSLLPCINGELMNSVTWIPSDDTDQIRIGFYICRQATYSRRDDKRHVNGRRSASLTDIDRRRDVSWKRSIRAVSEEKPFETVAMSDSLVLIEMFSPIVG